MHIVLTAGAKPIAAVAVSSPFDIGAAWRRLAAASWLNPAHWMQWAVVIRCTGTSKLSSNARRQAPLLNFSFCYRECKKRLFEQVDVVCLEA